MGKVDTYRKLSEFVPPEVLVDIPDCPLCTAASKTLVMRMSGKQPDLVARVFCSSCGYGPSESLPEDALIVWHKVADWVAAGRKHASLKAQCQETRFQISWLGDRN